VLKKSSSFVLTGHCRLTDLPARTDVALVIPRVADLVAALLEGLFEHPACYPDPVRDRREVERSRVSKEFQQPGGTYTFSESYQKAGGAE
jgi:hypothetical protein